MVVVLAIALLVTPAAALPTEIPCRLDTNLVRDANFDNVSGIGAWKLVRDKPQDRGRRAASVVVYGAHAGEWPGVKGCSTCDGGYLRLSLQGIDGTAGVEETIDVARFASDIDEGHIRAALGGELGARVNGGATVVLRAVFLDARGHELGDMETRPFEPTLLPKPEAGDASMTMVATGGGIPAQTRKVRIRIELRSMDEAHDYAAFADNVTFTLQHH
jgi:hypothetical protein